MIAARWEPLDRRSSTMRIDLIPDDMSQVLSAPPVVVPSSRGRRSAADVPSEIQGPSFRGLFENLYDATLVTDLSGAIVAANARAATFFGLGEDRLQLLNIVDLIYGAGDELLDTIRANLEREAFTLIEAFCIRSDKTIFPSETAVNRLDFKEEYLCFLVRDISIQMSALEDFTQERDLLSSLMDNMTDHIYFKDAQSRFIRVNKSLATVFGLNDPSEAIGKSDFDFFSEEHANQAYADEQEIMRTGVPIIGKDEKETWPDGSTTWVSTTKMPLLNKEGGIIGCFGISRHCTEHKKDDVKQQELLEELKRTNRELQVALNEVRTLGGLLPICANCKKIRDDKGYWNTVEQYLETHADAQFTHGYCPECMNKLIDDVKRDR